jgi:hypothetical protein
VGSQILQVGVDEAGTGLLAANVHLKMIDVREPESGTWMRSCPQCQQFLSKPFPLELVRCGCGWEWKV